MNPIQNFEEQGKPSLSKSEHFVNDARQFDITILSHKALITTNLDEFMDELIKIVSKSLGTEYVKILELTEDKKRLKLIKGIGWHDGVVGTEYVEVDYSSQAGYTLINEKPIIVTNFENETRFTPPPLLTDHQVASGISIIISGLQGPYGVLGAHSKIPREFTVNDVNFFNSAGHILSTKIIQQESLDKLRAEENKYKTLMEYASDAILISDLEGNLIDVNAKACSLTQYSKEELLSLNGAELYDKEEIKRLPLQSRTVKSGENRIIERKLLRKDKTKIPVEINFTLLPNTTTIQAIVRDISERRKTENFIRTNQKMEAINRLSGGLTHDFNNYLTIIIGYTEKILNSGFNEANKEELRQDIIKIKKTTEKASALFRNLMSFSSKNHYELSKINVNNLIIELEKSFRSFIGEKIKLQVDFEKKINETRTNPEQLQQAIINLVINSKDALEKTKKAKIIIKTYNYQLKTPYINFALNAQPGKFVAIEVSDNGEGMSEEVKAHIFEPFFTTKADKNSTGLGLATIYGFVNESNGFITVDSIEQKGTTITMYLPICKDEDGEEEELVREQYKESMKEKEKGIKTVLLIEDNTELLNVLSLILAKKGYKVEKALNGREGLEVLEDNKQEIDLVISDIVMPELDGIEMMRKMQEQKISKKVILMSGYSIENPLEIEYDSEMIFMHKPFSMDELLKAIERFS